MPTAALIAKPEAAPTFNPAPRHLWASTPIHSRLQILRKARHLLAESAADLATTLDHLPRTRADSLAAEVLPLLEACRFLERNAATILRPRKLGRSLFGRTALPFWLAGISTTVERVPFGTILVIAPANYPLFLPSVQALQALAAGNAVVWKPGRGGRRAALLVARLLTQAGLPEGLLSITEESIEAATHALAARPDKIIFTGSAHAGRQVLHAAADLIIPVVAELSGCDAVFVLPSAHPQTVLDALTFGMRLNASQTCMAPRRLILIANPDPTNPGAPSLDSETWVESPTLPHASKSPAAPSLPSSSERLEYRPKAGRTLQPTHQSLIDSLKQSFSTLPPTQTSLQTQAQLNPLLTEALALGAEIHGTPGQPILVLHATPAMAITRTDLFTPILSVLIAESAEEALEIHKQSPYGLTAAIFGNEAEALALSETLDVGTVLINDLIVPTADPRVSFPARRASGFGTTRGAEGLLEMTSPRTVSVRHKNNRRHLQPTGPAHVELFHSVIAMSHSPTWSQRFQAFRRMVAAARKIK